MELRWMGFPTRANTEPPGDDEAPLDDQRNYGEVNQERSPAAVEIKVIFSMVDSMLFKLVFYVLLVTRGF